MIELFVSIVDKVKRMMGWCPQKDFMENARIENHEHYFFNSNEKRTYAGKKLKALTDYQFSNVIIAGGAAYFGFLIAGLVFPFFFGLSILSILLTSVILLVQDRTTIELISNAMIIKRTIFKPVEISKESILKIEVLKNPNHRFRWAVISLVIIGLIYWLMNAINTLSRALERDPFLYFIYMVFIEFTILIFVIVLTYKWYIRSKYENFLKITSKTNRKVSIYADDPAEIANKLGTG